MSNAPTSRTADEFPPSLPASAPESLQGTLDFSMTQIPPPLPLKEAVLDTGSASNEPELSTAAGVSEIPPISVADLKRGRSSTPPTKGPLQSDSKLPPLPGTTAKTTGGLAGKPAPSLTAASGLPALPVSPGYSESAPKSRGTLPDDSPRKRSRNSPRKSPRKGGSPRKKSPRKMSPKKAKSSGFVENESPRRSPRKSPRKHESPRRRGGTSPRKVSEPNLKRSSPRKAHDHRKDGSPRRAGVGNLKSGVSPRETNKGSIGHSQLSPKRKSRTAERVSEKRASGRGSPRKGTSPRRIKKDSPRKKGSPRKETHSPKKLKGLGGSPRKSPRLVPQNSVDARAHHFPNTIIRPTGAEDTEEGPGAATPSQTRRDQAGLSEDPAPIPRPPKRKMKKETEVIVEGAEEQDWELWMSSIDVGAAMRGKRDPPESTYGANGDRTRRGTQEFNVDLDLSRRALSPASLLRKNLTSEGGVGAALDFRPPPSGKYKNPRSPPSLGGLQAKFNFPGGEKNQFGFDGFPTNLKNLYGQLQKKIQGYKSKIRQIGFEISDLEANIEHGKKTMPAQRIAELKRRIGEQPSEREVGQLKSRNLSLCRQRDEYIAQSEDLFAENAELRNDTATQNEQIRTLIEMINRIKNHPNE